MTSIIFQWWKPFHPFSPKTAQNTVWTNTGSIELQSIGDTDHKLCCLLKIGIPVIYNVSRCRWSKLKISPWVWNCIQCLYGLIIWPPINLSSIRTIVIYPINSKSSYLSTRSQFRIKWNFRLPCLNCSVQMGGGSNLMNPVIWLFGINYQK